MDKIDLNKKIILFKNNFGFDGYNYNRDEIL